MTEGDVEDDGRDLQRRGKEKGKGALTPALSRGAREEEGQGLCGEFDDGVDGFGGFGDFQDDGLAFFCFAEGAFG